MTDEKFSRRFFDRNGELLLRFMLEELTQTQKCYIIMYYADKKTMRQIASECGVNPSTVSRTISRAVMKMKKAAGLIGAAGAETESNEKSG